jgi:hypothetical protein
MLNWEGCGLKRRWPSLRYYPSIFLEGLRKTMKNLSQDNQSQTQYLNPRPPEYEAGVLTIRPQCSL